MLSKIFFPPPLSVNRRGLTAYGPAYSIWDAGFRNAAEDEHDTRLFRRSVDHRPVPEITLFYRGSKRAGRFSCPPFFVFPPRGDLGDCRAPPPGALRIEKPPGDARIGTDPHRPSAQSVFLLFEKGNDENQNRQDHTEQTDHCHPGRCIPCSLI